MESLELQVHVFGGFEEHVSVRIAVFHAFLIAFCISDDKPFLHESSILAVNAPGGFQRSTAEQAFDSETTGQ